MSAEGYARRDMGQEITVVEKPSATPGVVRFETNRSITGMGHERYRRGEPVAGDRPPDELARRLFATGRVDAVHIYSNVITVDLSQGARTDGLRELIHELFIFYRPGVVAGPDGFAVPTGSSTGSSTEPAA
jgi:hypothetical protein